MFSALWLQEVRIFPRAAEEALCFSPFIWNGWWITLNVPCSECLDISNHPPFVSIILKENLLPLNLLIAELLQLLVNSLPPVSHPSSPPATAPHIKGLLPAMGSSLPPSRWSSTKILLFFLGVLFQNIYLVTSDLSCGIWDLLLQYTGVSLVAVHGLQRAWGLQRVGSEIWGHRLCCPRTCRIFVPQQGLNPWPLNRKVDS